MKVVKDKQYKLMILSAINLVLVIISKINKAKDKLDKLDLKYIKKEYKSNYYDYDLEDL